MNYGMIITVDIVILELYYGYQNCNIQKKELKEFKDAKVTSNGKENSLTAIHNHPENYSFSLTDITTFNKIKSIKTMIVLTDD